MKPIQIDILLFDEVEVLDCCGPYEVFTTASRVLMRDRGFKEAPFDVATLSRSEGPVRARAGLRIVPDSILGKRPVPTVLVVPGGVVDEPLSDASLVRWIATTSARTRITASVCTGAFLLAAAGLLNGKRATTHWEDQDDLARRFPQVRVERNVPWVDEGGVVTSGGISAGIHMSLHLVERLVDREAAVATARQLEYRWEGG
ncbi:MAG: DJ-1/PfpI family protein [Deltaproteobacteria bacterium]|nr:DJ-1/PfpI family protein [Deltaproteobacteria bacterium]